MSHLALTNTKLRAVFVADDQSATYCVAHACQTFAGQRSRRSVDRRRRGTLGWCVCPCCRGRRADWCVKNVSTSNTPSATLPINVRTTLPLRKSNISRPPRVGTYRPYRPSVDSLVRPTSGISRAPIQSETQCRRARKTRFATFLSFSYTTPFSESIKPARYGCFGMATIDVMSM